MRSSTGCYEQGLGACLGSAALAQVVFRVSGVLPILLSSLDLLSITLPPQRCGHKLSAGTGMVQPFALLGVCRTFWMYGKECLGASVVVAYINDSGLRDAYR